MERSPVFNGRRSGIERWREASDPGVDIRTKGGRNQRDDYRLRTTITYIEESAYKVLREEFVNGTRLEVMDDAAAQKMALDLCFKVPDGGASQELEAPTAAPLKELGKQERREEERRRHCSCRRCGQRWSCDDDVEGGLALREMHSESQEKPQAFERRTWRKETWSSYAKIRTTRLETYRDKWDEGDDVSKVNGSTM